MKNTMMKVTLAVTMLVGGVLGQGAVDVSKADAAAPTTKAQPIMTDNLSKYGLKKDVELPVTVTTAGLSYTLEKIMIYDFNSTEAINLRKTYKYGDQSGLIAKPQYFIWTKITVKNNSKKTIDNINGEYWDLRFGKDIVDPVSNWSRIGKTNDKLALNRIVLKPGEQLSTYQAYMYKGSFNYFAIGLAHDGQFSEKYIMENQ
ncbi:hypothetical protein [Paenibacillus sp. NPDC058177]|uniref:hypothetical protein n=1 Tax=Paenibacillus sp. NPDC058177 TaxID=3346369 RepID=UPI0036D87698